MAAARNCHRCDRRMVAITLEIAEQLRTLRSCSHCDIREWETDAGGTNLTGVLADLSEASTRP